MKNKVQKSQLTEGIYMEGELAIDGGEVEDVSRIGKGVIRAGTIGTARVGD